MILKFSYIQHTVFDAIILALSTSVIYQVLWFLVEPNVMGEYSWLIFDIFYCALSVFVCSLIILSKYRKRIAEQTEKNRQMEIALLLGQLDSHFMFNNLSALAGLMGAENERGQEFLAKLSNVYRYIASHVSEDTVAVNDAVKFIRDYHDLVDVRHPGHFRISISKELEQSSDRILTMSLQLLAENAIKHNKHSLEQPLIIDYRMQDDFLVVSNSINRMNTVPDSLHIGLENLQRRYELFCGKKCEVLEQDGMFVVKIPIIKQ